MSEPRRSTGTTQSHGAEEDLPYRIELWDARHRKVERVLARAARAALARAIFAAARQEYPERRITLQRGTRLLAEAP
ncbi:MAG TPA: hypothetical protein VGL83_17945 [Stellaceae bacterium]|jgi:hypothetical protein